MSEIAGHIPLPGEVVEGKLLHFEVLASTDRKVERVRVGLRRDILDRPILIRKESHAKARSPAPCHSHTQVLALILIAFLATAPAGARKPNLSKYPLRVHVLVARDAQRQNRMSASGSVACDDIDDMLSSSIESSDGTISSIGISGIFGDPCSFNTGPMAGRLLYVQSAQSYSGEGRGDLASHPAGRRPSTSNIKTATGCERSPVSSRCPRDGRSLDRRWMVLIPSDGIPVAGRPLPPAKRSLPRPRHEFVYLLIPPGRLIEVSQEVYWAKPRCAFTSAARHKPCNGEHRRYQLPSVPHSRARIMA